MTDAQIPIIADKKRPSWRLNHSFETTPIAELPLEVREKKQKEAEANQYYSDIENCAARIAMRLREMDNIDLNPETNHTAGVSNQQRFLDDQCVRAQSALPTEFLMRKLNAREINQEIVEIDERITFNSRNWKTSLLDMGLKESDIESYSAVDDAQPTTRKTVVSKPKATTAKQGTATGKTAAVPDTAAAAAVRLNFTLQPPKERDIDDYSLEELDQLNDEVFKKMNEVFSFDAHVSGGGGGGSGSEHMVDKISGIFTLSL